jgi:hypothetical protein
MNKLADKFYHEQGVKFEAGSFEARSYTRIGIAPELIGMEWNDITLAYLYHFTPCNIRVIKDGGSGTLDAQQGRITVHVDSDNKIESITMEANVGLPHDIPHGDALRAALKYGVDSPQLDWHRKAESYMHDGINGISYAKIDGKLIEFPKIKG